MFTALGIDPGGTTGWAAVHVREIALLNRRDLLPGLEYECGEVSGDFNAQAKELLAIIDEFAPWPVVVESFELRKKNVELSPIEIAARLDFAMDITGETDRLFYQTASEAKSTITDDRMKEWSIWEPGVRHARDGIRHALLFLRRCQSDRSLMEAAYGAQISQAGSVAQ